MVTRPLNFKHSDVRRAFRAAEAAGVRNPTVRVVCKDGTELHIAGAGRKDFAQGGTTRMLGPQTAGTQRPGVTAHAVRGGAPGSAKASGGPRTSRSPSLAVPARPGRTSPLKRGR
jgi:hypothetical protein